MKKQFGEYYLGFDIGTDSIGWAVTDLEYNIQKLNGKALWGIRLFDAGKTAEERRLHRSARRRRQRQIQRIDLIKDLFAKEIDKVDPGFYLRLEESKFYPDDKSILQRNALFNDINYTDKTYLSEFPTIYHLRKALIENKKAYDIRLLYLAIHHIIKYRGHFLFEGQDMNNVKNVRPLFSQVNQYLTDEYETEFAFSSLEEVENILKDKSLKKRDKKKQLLNILSVQEKQQQIIVDLICGYTIKLSDLFCEDEYEDSELNKITFSDGSFDEKKDSISDLIEDKMFLVETLKAIYDWGLLAEILHGYEYISYAKVDIYEKHKKDLKLLKNVIRKYTDKSTYDSIFKSHKEQNNYCAYSAKNSSKKEEPNKKCTQEDFCSYISKILNKISVIDENLDYLKKEAENISLLPKQVTKDNSVIPCQIHLHELRKILDNATGYFPFLKDSDEKGISVYDKIISIFQYRIPYYVGPINNAHKDTGFSWVEKRVNEKVYPWNFSEVIDEESSAEKFIRRMTNKCTYIYSADVLPKNSLLYSEYQVLNEINNLRINDNPISNSLKMEMFENLFLKEKKVTIKKITSYLISNGYITHGSAISGIDIEIKSSLTSYIDFKGILGNKANDKDMVENIIKWITLFGDSRKILCEKIKSEYGSIISQEEITNLSNLKYKGWGRLSKELLCDVYDVDKETGELVNIISMMRGKNENLMQLLSSRYSYSDKISQINAKSVNRNNEISYDIVDELRLSPAVKRGIWQSLQILNELLKIMQHSPKKIFIEFARQEEKVKKRTISRKESLVELYKSCKDQYAELVSDLEVKTDSDFRDDKLYLYYTQLGRCMYTGESIDLFTLLSDTTSMVYDIDHIYPRSKIKDDSLENRVLVKKTANMQKGDNYPLPVSFMQQKALWNHLHNCKLIGDKKYNRLTSRNSLTDDELANFIERQLVETRQSTKAFAEILKTVIPESDIVYVKANNVSEFRNNFEIVKIRDINDLHHAKDAYLNIVVGNVYDVKFTRNPRNFIVNSNAKYNLRDLFKYDVRNQNCTAWKGGKEGTIITVKKTVEKNNILFTRYSYEFKGEISDQQLKRKGKGQLPIKASDKRLLNIERYGGYNKASTAYFFLVEHDKGKKRIRSIEYVPVHLAKDIEKDNSKLLRYCKEDLNLGNPDIKISKIKINTLFAYNGFLMYLKARTGDQYVCNLGFQLYLPIEYEKYIKNIYKGIDGVKSKKTSKENAGINFEKEINIKIYDYLVNKLNNTIYSIKLVEQGKFLEEARDKYIRIDEYDQAETLTKVFNIFMCNSALSDLTLIGGTKNHGRIYFSKNIGKENKISIINQSITGVFSKEVNLNTI